MRDAILSQSPQLVTGIALGSAQRIEKPYRSIISCGMGGSAIAGEMLSMVKTDVIIHWDYDLPASAGSQDLIICTSWSGQTEETISSYQAAVAKGCETLVITSGGRLADLARQHGSPLIILPADSLAPRTATGLMAGALFAALGLERELPSQLDPASLEQQGRELATVIGGRMPVIYSSYPWRKLTGFWKMAYSETAKRQVMANWLPSAAHNEIVGWEGPYRDNAVFLLFRDQAEDTRYAANFDALLAVLGKKEYTVSIVELSGNALLEKAFNSYILALWTGYFAAQSLGVDPQATKFLDEFKQLKG
jgi:glucose/mannose-6-phosphate isomerase